MQIQSSTFSQNTAKSSGSVLLADDDSQISFTDSMLTNNGNYSCYDPPTVIALPSLLYQLLKPEKSLHGARPHSLDSFV